MHWSTSESAREQALLFTNETQYTSTPQVRSFPKMDTAALRKSHLLLFTFLIVCSISCVDLLLKKSEWTPVELMAITRVEGRTMWDGTV